MPVKRYNPFKYPGFYLTIVLAGAWYAAVLYLIVPRPEPKLYSPVVRETHRPSEADIQRGLDYLRNEQRLDHERRMRHSMDSIDWSLQRMANDRQYGRVIIQD